MRHQDAWTRAHDLALVYIGLAYGTDKELADEELDTIIEALLPWREAFSREQVQEVVMEAATAFLEGEHPEDEVLRSISALGDELDEADRTRALEDLVHIAEADGVLLRSERTFVSMLASAWGLKPLAARLLDAAEASAEAEAPWSLLHDIGLIYVVVAHATDERLGDGEVQAMVDRPREWQPELDADAVRAVLGEALSLYAQEPDHEALHRSLITLKQSLPYLQRLALLDDLTQIARADGAISETEEEVISAVAEALGIGLRLNGQPPAEA